MFAGLTQQLSIVTAGAEGAVSAEIAPSIGKTTPFSVTSPQASYYPELGVMTTGSRETRPTVGGSRGNGIWGIMNICFILNRYSKLWGG